MIFKIIHVLSMILIMTQLFRFRKRKSVNLIILCITSINNYHKSFDWGIAYHTTLLLTFVMEKKTRRYVHCTVAVGRMHDFKVIRREAEKKVNISWNLLLIHMFWAYLRFCTFAFLHRHQTKLLLLLVPYIGVSISLYT